jgi:hypothetical protein
MSMLKRQRELKKAEKAARKRAKRHGVHEEGFTEPRPTVSMSDLTGGGSDEDDETSEEQNGEDAIPKAEVESK